MPYQLDIVDALRDWGLTVVTVPGWQSRGSSDFNPHGHVLHHDVIPDNPGTNDHIPTLIVNGRSDLAGPLANFWLETDGDVHLCAAGRANHAGEGGWNGLSDNSSVWGTEMNNLGVPTDFWPDIQLEAMSRLAACTMDFSNFPAANVCGHKEWAPNRKIDPHSINMSAFRTRVAQETKDAALTPEQMAEIKRVTVVQGQKTRRLVRDLAVNERTRDRAQTAKLTAIFNAVDALPDE